MTYRELILTAGPFAAFDMSGNGYIVDLIGGQTYLPVDSVASNVTSIMPGETTQCIKLTRSGVYAELPIMRGGDISVEFWLHYHDYQDGIHRRWIAGSDLGNYRWRIDWLNGVMRIRSYRVDFTLFELTLNVGQTYHVVLTRKRATDAEWRLYIDGALYGQYDAPIGTAGQDHDTGLGGFGFHSPLYGAPANVPHCSIQWASFFHRVLSDAEVLAHYQAGMVLLHDVRISGVVTLDGNPVAAPLRLYAADSGMLINVAQSSAQSGAYVFGGLEEGRDYYVMSLPGGGARPLVHGPVTGVDAPI